MVTSRPHVASRAEDTVNRWVGRVLRRRGWTVRVEPFTGYGSTGWVRVLARTVLAPPSFSPPSTTRADDPVRSVRGWRSFATAQVGHSVVDVEVGGTTHQVHADRGGYVDAVVPADLDPGWHQVRLSIGGGTGPGVLAPVLVVDPQATGGLVSDIDDTVMVTRVPRLFLAAWNSLVLDENARQPVPGMAVLYDRLTRDTPSAPVFYLSTGAWNSAPALRRFLRRHGYPDGPLLLTDWGPTQTGWFRSGRAHKDAQLRRLLEELPGIRWLLVGDDGQHDPEIYARVATEHPDRVRAVVIRELTAAQQVLAHGSTGTGPLPRRPASISAALPGPPDLRGRDGTDLREKLARVGIDLTSADSR